MSCNSERVKKITELTHELDRKLYAARNLKKRIEDEGGVVSVVEGDLSAFVHIRIY